MHDDGYFDEDVAATYDNDPAMFAPEAVDPAVSFLSELAGKGQALEFAIGTGRIALPLARKGVAVHGIEMSKAMVARLRAKEGGANISVPSAIWRRPGSKGSFLVAYLVFNTINNLTTQDAQIACFQNPAAHLEPGGCFVVEVGVPSLQRLPKGERLLAFERTGTQSGIDEFDVATQAFTSHHIKIVDGKIQKLSVPFRYVWPAELDLMARLAGLTLKERWSNWRREPFTNDSDSHVSVWEKITA